MRQVLGHSDNVSYGHNQSKSHKSKVDRLRPNQHGDICERDFSSEKDLETHMLTAEHFTSEVFVSDICQMFYAQVSKLIR